MYDVFGNRTQESRGSSIYTAEGMSGCDNLPDVSVFATTRDNRLVSRSKQGCS
jgi:hypothetical protein